MEEIDFSIGSDGLSGILGQKKNRVNEKTVSKVQKKLLSMIDKRDEHKFPSLKPEKNLDSKEDYFIDEMESETDTIISTASRYIDSPYVSLSAREENQPPVRLRLSSSLSSLNLDNL